MSSAPPIMTVNWPPSAPAWPPETGASRKPMPCCAARSASSRAREADVVVWSTNSAPGAMPANAPVSPSATARTSASSPTQQNTAPQPAAASAGVRQALPPCSPTQASALPGVRLYTLTSCPRAARWPAMGYPMTPRPMNATRCCAMPASDCLDVMEHTADGTPRTTARESRYSTVVCDCSRRYWAR